MYQTDRARHLVLGALVADTAAMGTHWIYDQAHLQKIAPEKPEFTAPDPANYEGVPAFYAHPTRENGQTTQYGEQVLVMHRALAANAGTYDAQVYADHFRSHFGYGGGWVGYIDHATRDTLNNFVRAEDDALAAAQALPFDGPAKVTHALAHKALNLIPTHEGTALRAQFEKDVRATHDDADTLAHGFAVLDAVLQTPRRFGAQDEQMPATAKLPPLVAAMAGADDTAFFDAIDSAVRTTSDHPNAHDLGRVCARMMQRALTAETLNDIIDAGAASASPAAQKLIKEARGMTDQDNAAVTKHFGMACDLSYGVPSVIHNMLTAPSYTDAIRRNIHAGGDTCGRAIILGSILGALYGVGGEKGIPEDWTRHMRIDPDILRLLT